MMSEASGPADLAGASAGIFLTISVNIGDKLWDFRDQVECSDEKIAKLKEGYSTILILRKPTGCLQKKLTLALLTGKLQ